MATSMMLPLLIELATANERLLLNNGLSVSPLNGQVNGQGPQPKSLREVVHQIDNERDLQHYVAAFSSKVPPRNSDIKYERHAVRIMCNVVVWSLLGLRLSHLSSRLRPPWLDNRNRRLRYHRQCSSNSQHPISRHMDGKGREFLLILRNLMSRRSLPGVSNLQTLATAQEQILCNPQL